MQEVLLRLFGSLKSKASTSFCEQKEAKKL
jgi:hypothetical protein